MLVVGATGSVGRHVVAESVRQGYETRALVRDSSRASRLDPAAQRVLGELTDDATLTEAVADIDAVIFTQGSSYGDAAAAEAVDYGAVKNVLKALGGRHVRIALMTAIGVTRRGSTRDWKRRSERLVRASGNPYTIVRPGWFDYNEDHELEITLLQGDTRHAGSPAQNDLQPVFETLDKDPIKSLDGVRDQANMPANAEPERVRQDLTTLGAGKAKEPSLNSVREDELSC